MPRVLVGPTKADMSNDEYGKSYNLLNNLHDKDFIVDTYTQTVSDRLDPQNVTVYPLGGSNRIAYYAKLYWTLLKELRNGPVDIYHHMNLSYRWFNPLLVSGLQRDIPVVIGPCQAGHAIMAEEFNRMISSWVGSELPRPLTDPLHGAVDATRDVVLDPPRMDLFKRTLKAADRVVVVHEEAREVYADFVDESKLRTIPLGVDPDFFNYSQPADSKELVAIGSLRERKGYDILFEALDRIRQEYPDVHLNVFGDGPLEDDLHEQVKRLDLERNVTFHGYVDQSIVREHLSRARVFIHPSRSESFSLVRLEAMSTGCPVVVTDISGAREMVRDGEEGFVVPIESPGPIADAVTTLLSDYELTRQVSRQARDRIEEKYDWRKIAAEYLEVYRSLSG
ncbi:group 1 glycosyl transferase [Haloarcula rubripromontorii]|uniref:Group 1 glycosyl transferase n=1 Tax=Haloarcula rubripromontorii TaxID=1705562 RepID=A0A0M9AIK1_9EURY|nr:glycosyltransferase [Haloarcula rubripromontorii]KOX92732.1 group 1 glycosyl transferase [Haloarcula rubripromontorii]